MNDAPKKCCMCDKPSSEEFHNFCCSRECYDRYQAVGIRGPCPTCEAEQDGQLKVFEAFRDLRNRATREALAERQSEAACCATYAATGEHFALCRNHASSVVPEGLASVVRFVLRKYEISNVGHHDPLLADALEALRSVAVRTGVLQREPHERSALSWEERARRLLGQFLPDEKDRRREELLEERRVLLAEYLRVGGAT